MRNTGPERFDFIEKALREKERCNLRRVLRPLEPVSPAEVRMNGRILVNSEVEPMKRIDPVTLKGAFRRCFVAMD